MRLRSTSGIGKGWSSRVPMYQPAYSPSVGKPANCVVLQAASGAPARATKKARREIIGTWRQYFG